MSRRTRTTAVRASARDGALTLWTLGVGPLLVVAAMAAWAGGRVPAAILGAALVALPLPAVASGLGRRSGPSPASLEDELAGRARRAADEAAGHADLAAQASTPGP